MKRKVLSFMFAVMLLMSAIPSAFATADEAVLAADHLYSLGLFSGTGIDEKGNPIYDLERAPTRNEAITMLVALLGKSEEAKSGTWDTPFTDVADWAKPFVGYAYTNGLTAGTSPTTYGGNDLVTASQYLTFVLKALGYQVGNDFQWDKAWILSDELGITDGRYNETAKQFLRGDVAIISNNALKAEIKGTEEKLFDVLNEESTFEIHFLDVGQGDSALVLCDGKAMLIDGGEKDNSSFIYSYLRKHEISHLDYIIATHGHDDHVGGLSGALNYATVGTVYCSVTEYANIPFFDFIDNLEKQGKNIQIPKVGDRFNLGRAIVQIVGVNSDVSNHNDTSIVLRITYGDTTFLFTGDAERAAEQVILEKGYTLESTVLKIGHHGGNDSTTYPFLREVAPQYAVISVGNENSYGHPTEGALSRLRDADVTVYRTDLQGTIICTSDSKTVSFSVEKNKNADTMEPGKQVEKEEDTNQGTTVLPPAVQVPGESVFDFVGNVNTRKFHYSWCDSVDRMKESNKFYYSGTSAEMVAMGFDSCAKCMP